MKDCSPTESPLNAHPLSSTASVDLQIASELLEAEDEVLINLSTHSESQAYGPEEPALTSSDIMTVPTRRSSA